MPDSLTITVNGSRRTIAADTWLPDVLLDLGISPEATRGVAVAINDEIVRRAAWGATALKAGDRVEIVTARQGG
ncbi:MAG: sulfur carrier protein ThiS [Rhodothermales bacterium]